MQICGRLVYRDVTYFMILKQLISFVEVQLFSPRGVGLREDFSEYPELTPLDLVQREPDLHYVFGAQKKMRATGKTHTFRNTDLVRDFFLILGQAQSYSFPESSILVKESHEHLGELFSEFRAMDSSFEFRFKRVNQVYTELYISTLELHVDLKETPKYKTCKEIPWEVVEQVRKGPVDLSTLKSVDYDMLKEIIDISFYEDSNGNILKDYDIVENIREFEEQIMTPLLLEYKASEELRVELLLGTDTETTGLNFYDYPEGSEDLDRMVFLSISWKDNQGRGICIDMEYFNNVSLEYVLRRLSPFLTNPEDNFPGNENGHVRKVPILKVKEKPLSSVAVMESFGEVVNPYQNTNHVWTEDEYEFEIIDEILVDRTQVTNTTHNGPFDARVFLRHKSLLYIDQDTLLLSFCLDPKNAKGNNALKALTRRIFGHETPELDDILGKGHKDKFRYLHDRRVVAIYGCADVDYPRQILKFFKKIYPQQLWESNLKYNIWILNELVYSEFYGLQTDEEPFRTLADSTFADIEILKDFLFKYVGSLVSVRTKVNMLTREYEAGLLNVDEKGLREMISRVRPDKDAYYQFEIPGNDVRTVLYDILRYPVKVRTNPTEKNPEGLPSVDKNAMKKLMSYPNESGSSSMLMDLMDSSGKKVLLEAKKFNSYRFPVAYLLSVYGSLQKEYTSYYKPVVTKNVGGKIFNSFSLARIETMRIANASQTMKSSLKYLILPNKPQDQYIIVFDQRQVEPRIMQSLSGHQGQIEKYKDPEKDSHTEIGAEVSGIPAHKLPKKVRKDLKAVTLGKPYGSGDRKMCAGIHDGVVNEDTLFDTRMKVHSWEVSNSHLMEMFERFRDEPLTPAPDSVISPELRQFVTKGENYPVGVIKNIFGFWRLFNLSNLDKEAIGKIRRPSGNYPIQSTAAIFFRIILKRFRDRLRAEGLYGKVQFMMLVHDELVMSVDNDLNPIQVYKMLQETCTFTAKGHTNYYIGLNTGDNWGDGKEDANEAPVYCVTRLIKRWDEGEFRNDDYLNHKYSYYDGYGNYLTKTGPGAYMFQHIREYIQQRIKEVVESITPVGKGILDIPKLMDQFSNYMVRSYIIDYYAPNGKISNPKDDDEVYQRKFETWLLEVYGPGLRMKTLTGEVTTLAPQGIEEIELELWTDSEIPETEMSFDLSGETEEFSGSFYVDDDEDDEFLYIDSIFDTSKPAESFGDILIKDTPRYKNLSIVNKQVFLKIPRKRHVDKLKALLLQYQSKEGLKVVFRTPIEDIRWVVVKAETPWDEIDQVLGGL